MEFDHLNENYLRKLQKIQVNKKFIRIKSKIKFD